VKSSRISSSTNTINTVPRRVKNKKDKTFRRNILLLNPGRRRMRQTLTLVLEGKNGWQFHLEIQDKRHYYHLCEQQHTFLLPSPCPITVEAAGFPRLNAAFCLKVTNPPATICLARTAAGLYFYYTIYSLRRVKSQGGRLDFDISLDERGSRKYRPSAVGEKR
jgi:hypothetical protein